MQVFHKIPTSTPKACACRHHELDAASLKTKSRSLGLVFFFATLRVYHVLPVYYVQNPLSISKSIMQLQEAWWVKLWTLNVALSHTKDVFLWPLKANISTACFCQGYVYIRQLLCAAAEVNSALQITVQGGGDDPTSTLDTFQLLSGHMDWLPGSGWSKRKFGLGTLGRAHLHMPRPLSDANQSTVSGHCQENHFKSIILI